LKPEFTSEVRDYTTFRGAHAAGLPGSDSHQGALISLEIAARNMSGQGAAIHSDFVASM
jgi:hypothetical protein